MDIHYITADNYLEANQAIRDILYLYDDAVTSYSGFGHNLEVGTFDPFKYLGALLDEPPSYTFGIDMELLHEGSAVALLYHLSAFWDEFDGENIGQDKLTGRIKNSLAEGLFDIVPLAKVAANAAFQDESRFRGGLATLGTGGVTMTTRLEQAFTEASKLPPQEQDALAGWLLAELESERRWEKLFADSQDVLSKLAAEALTEHRSGQTQDLDPERI